MHTVANFTDAKISPHFNTKEFYCKCGGRHDIKISKNLIEMLEKLYTALNCSKIVVTSGYRCPTHDKRVGGSGTGQHAKGTAADVVCYGADGKIINTKIVSCVAQDLGFKGIGNVDNTYTVIHLDVRTSGIWYGDEVVNTKHLTNNFYNYYKLNKNDVYGKVENTVEKCEHGIEIKIDGKTVLKGSVEI